MSNGVTNKGSIIAIIAIILGGSGLGFAAFNMISPQPQGIEGPPGNDGVDGLDGLNGLNGTNGLDGIGGINAPGGIVVGILDPDNEDIISGNVSIRALIFGSDNYSVKILINGSLNATAVPFEWDTTLLSDGWWNITAIVKDLDTNNESQDTVMVYVQNVFTTYTYYSASETEIQDALTSIGTGSGTIIITESIILTSPITIQGGGSYIIESIGFVTIDCNGNRRAFDIRNAASTVIRNLVIDASGFTNINTEAINVQEISNRPVYIENVQIFGDSDYYGIGIEVKSENVWVSNSDISQMTRGFHIQNPTGKVYIRGNLIVDCSNTGIYIMSPNIIIADNIIRSSDYGIYISAASYSIVADNIIEGYTADDASIQGGILITSGNYNTISGNVVYNYQNLGLGIGFGLFISSGNNNTVVGNNFNSNENNLSDGGIGTVLSGNYN